MEEKLVIETSDVVRPYDRWAYPDDFQDQSRYIIKRRFNDDIPVAASRRIVEALSEAVLAGRIVVHEANLVGRSKRLRVLDPDLAYAREFDEQIWRSNQALGRIKMSAKKVVMYDDYKIIGGYYLPLD